MSIRNLFKDQKGLSLVELIAAIIILAIALVPLSNLLNSSYVSFLEEQDKAYAMNEVQEGLNRILDDLHWYETSATAIQAVTLLDSSTANALVVSGSAIFYYYDSTNQTIMRTNKAIYDASKNIKVHKFEFTEDANPSYEFPLLTLTIELERGKSGKVSASVTHRMRKNNSS